MKFIKAAREREEKRIGDVYTECERRGCNRHFLKLFNIRIEMHPFEQTNAFFKMREIPTDKIRQWKIYLQVLIEKRPDSPMVNDWKKSLEFLEKMKR